MAISRLVGNSFFSQGGGFFPVKNKDSTSTVLYVPLNQTGTYTLLTHSTLFGGNSTTEPITLSAKFTNISSELISDSHNNEKPKSHITTSEILSKLNNDTMIIPNNDTMIIPNNDTMIISDSKSDSEFDLGLVIGITIGVAIGISFIFIIRQKNT
jgi:hypothetical protein